MASNPASSLYLATGGGLAATHPALVEQPAFVGPATEKQDNTFRARLIPFACWKVEDIRFDYDSSFVRPEIAKELEALKQLRTRHPGAVLSIFGHTGAGVPGQGPNQPARYKLVIRRTDSIWPVKMAEICTGHANLYKELEQEPENRKFLRPNGQWRDLYAGNEIYLPSHWEKAPGWNKFCAEYDVQKVESGSPGGPTQDDEYAKAVSGRRAAAIYALLTRRLDIWEDIYSNRGQFTTAIQGDRWGVPALQTMLATLGRTEETAGYEHSAGKRGELFRAYMDKLCGSASNIMPVKGNSSERAGGLKLTKEHFLARGRDPRGKGDYQGCGAFNPTVLSSVEADRPIRAGEQTKEEASNRRVVVLLFHQGADLDPVIWPCPRAMEGTPRCRERFWTGRPDCTPDKPQGPPQEQGTFHCRFYDRITTNSPCDRVRRLPRVEWFVARPNDLNDVAMRVFDSEHRQLLCVPVEEATYVDGERVAFDLSSIHPRTKIRVALWRNGIQLTLESEIVIGPIISAQGEAEAESSRKHYKIGATPPRELDA